MLLENGKNMNKFSFIHTGMLPTIKVERSKLQGFPPEKPKCPEGKIEIEGVGVFDIGKVPKRNLLQKILFCYISIPVGIAIVWIVFIFLATKGLR
jgi:hypothetical protein